MNKILQFTTYGLKNIEHPITLDFANQTISGGVNKVNSVKGVYGYNGAGKTALIKSMDFYRKLVTDPDYLIQKETQLLLKQLVNKKIKMFYVSCIFYMHNRLILRHSIKLIIDPKTNLVVISGENLDLLNGRTLNDKFIGLVKNEDNLLFVNRQFEKEITQVLDKTMFSKSSFVSSFVSQLFQYANQLKEHYEMKRLDFYILVLYTTVKTIEVCTLKSDELNNSLSYSQLSELIEKSEDVQDFLKNNKNYLNINDETIPVNELKEYKKTIKGLEKFLKLFKPELKSIQLELSQERDLFHIKKIFVYKDYPVEFEYESSGIKQLSNLYFYLLSCAMGQIVFIDEMDVNINAAYFKKLVSYFVNYGKGQLIFTTHNIESMEVLKGQKRSISAIGVDGHIDTWVGKGNRSPINDYLGGYFPHSPMNVEDFDFISIFEGE